MQQRRSWRFSSRALLGYLAIGVAGACGGDDGNNIPKCIPGQSIACAGSASCAGNQICKPDGTFGPCTCGGAGAAGNGGTAGRAGTAGVAGSTGLTLGTGIGGRAGASAGSGGRGGAAGSAGTTGAGGASAGTTGAGGASAGTTGAGGASAGTTGTAGASAGTTGTGGAAGTTATAGTGGAAGSGGAGGGGVCNPVAQTGCGVGQRCGWIYTSQTAGHNACLADGTVNRDGACGYGPLGETTGFDNCKKGTACISGVCKTICDANAAPDACPTNYLCGRYAGAPFDLAGTLGIGFCDSTCNPLTQTRDSDGAAACGSPNPSAPTLGCYGPLSRSFSFTCAPIISTTKTHGVAAGTPTYVNSCAPGYLPLRPDSSASSAPLCAALCRPAATSSASPANAPGLAGSGFTCPDKGAASPNECRYFWWMFEDTNPFMPSANSNTLGVCFNYPNYRFDSNGDMTLDMVYPSCATLSPTAHNYDLVLTDAEAWGCVAHP